MTDAGAVFDVRRMTGADLEPVRAIFAEVVEEGTTYADEHPPTREAFHAYWCGRGGEQWVAKDAERILGSYTLRPNHPGRGAHVATASYIVAASARGRGLGRALAEHSIARASALGFAALQFNFVVSTNHAAVRLWQRLGFTILATLPQAFRHPSHGLVDAYVMSLPLPPLEGGRARER